MFSISKSVRLTKSQDGGILLDVEHGAIFSLNPVATRIVELLEQEQTVSSLVAQIMHDFGVSDATIAEDVDAFLAKLRQQRLLQEPEAKRQPLSR